MSEENLVEYVDSWDSFESVQKEMQNSQEEEAKRTAFFNEERRKQTIKEEAEARSSS